MLSIPYKISLLNFTLRIYKLKNENIDRFSEEQRKKEKDMREKKLLEEKQEKQREKELKEQQRKLEREEKGKC